MSHKRHCMEMLGLQWEAGKFVGVGLDSEFRKIRKMALNDDKSVNPYKTIVDFNTQVIWGTHDVANSYFINHNFYLARGLDGLKALCETINRIHNIAPYVPIILNTCAGDIGNSNLAFIEYALGVLGVDGFTVQPWFGQDAMQPFLDLSHKCVIVACRTSNEGGSELQCLPLASHQNVKLYKTAAHNVANFWNKNGNCALLFGASSTFEISEVRDIVPDLPMFVPRGKHQRNPVDAVNADGEIKEIVRVGMVSNGKRGLVITSSRGIIFEDSPRQAATSLHNQIKAYREELFLTKAG